MYAGGLAALAGLGAVLARRRWGVGLLLGGPALMAVGLLLPAHERRTTAPVSSLDRFMPAWQFREFHAIDVKGTCDRAFAALERLRASDIPLFHFLTWIRRFGRSGPESILNPSDSIPLLAVATRHGFTELARDVPRELVIGTVLIAPVSGDRMMEPGAFAALRDPGYAKAALNFRFQPADSGCRVTTETRVFATDPHSRRVFARYWRVIYPGSALIRRMWLRAARAGAEREATVTFTDWNQWLREWNRELLARYEEEGDDAFLDPAVTPQVIGSGWLGAPPAPEDQLVRLEARLGMRLPPSYRGFLAESNGFLQPGVVVPRLLPAEEVDWYRTRNQEAIDAWRSTGGSDEADVLANSVQISAVERVGTAVYLLLPTVTRAEGEWEALYYAHWVPGIRRYGSFRELMENEYESLTAPPESPSRSRSFWDTLRWIFRRE